MGIIYEDNDIQVIETVTARGKTVQTVNKPGSPGANAESIAAKVEAAIAANNTFLALGANPTNAQVVAYVRVVARELNGIARLLSGKFDADDA